MLHALRFAVLLFLPAGLFAAATAWGGQALWFLAYTAAAASAYALLSWTCVRIALRRVALEETGIGRAEAAYRGEALPYRRRLSLSGPLLPGTWLGIEETWTCQGADRVVALRAAALPGFRAAAEWGGAKAVSERGQYVRETVLLTASDAFGLLRLSRKVRLPGRLWVLPRPSAAGAAAASRGGAGDPARAGLAAAWDAVPLVSGTRPYAPGDPWHRIHWRSSARVGSLRAKELELPAGGRQLVVLDAAGRGVSAQEAEAAVEAAAGLAKRWLELGETVRLAAADGGGPGGAWEARGAARLPELLRRLAELPPAEGGGAGLARAAGAGAAAGAAAAAVNAAAAGAAAGAVNAAAVGAVAAAGVAAAAVNASAAGAAAAAGEAAALAEAALREAGGLGAGCALTVVTPRVLPGLGEALLGRLPGCRAHIVYAGGLPASDGTIQAWAGQLHAAGLRLTVLGAPPASGSDAPGLGRMGGDGHGQRSAGA